MEWHKKGLGAAAHIGDVNKLLIVLFINPYGYCRYLCDHICVHDCYMLTILVLHANKILACLGWITPLSKTLPRQLERSE